MVKDLGLASGGIGDEALVKNVEDVLADLLELSLDLLAVVLDGGDVLVGALGLLLLLNGGDDAPRGTAGADNVLVGNGEQVALVDGELAAELGNLLHVGDHLIVALGLLAEAGEEGLAVVRVSFASGDGGAVPGRTNLSRWRRVSRMLQKKRRRGKDDEQGVDFPCTAQTGRAWAGSGIGGKGVLSGGAVGRMGWGSANGDDGRDIPQ